MTEVRTLNRTLRIAGRILRETGAPDDPNHSRSVTAERHG